IVTCNYARAQPEIFLTADWRHGHLIRQREPDDATLAKSVCAINETCGRVRCGWATPAADGHSFGRDQDVCVRQSLNQQIIAAFKQWNRQQCALRPYDRRVRVAIR